MGKNTFLDFINNSEFSKALDELSKSEQDNNELKINIALLKYYQGQMKDAISLLEDIYSDKNQLEDKITLKVTLLLLYYHISTNKSNYHIKEVRESLLK